MADEKTREEQIALIKKSVSEWNGWRAGRTDKADLSSADLSSADLRYTNLRYADLSFADMRYTNLRYADLRSANLRGEIKITRLLCRTYRSDEYVFFGFSTNAGPMIKAGCRLFSPGDYRAHVAKEYPGTPEAKETLRIIKYIEECAAEGEAHEDPA